MSNPAKIQCRHPWLLMSYLVLYLILYTTQLSAHPLGNNSVNRQAKLLLEPGRMVISYHMDLAEIPTLAATEEADAQGDGNTTALEWQNFSMHWARQVMPSLRLQADGQTLQLRQERAIYRIGKGEAGLATLHLEARFTAALPSRKKFSIDYNDTFQPQQTGWKEIWVHSAEAHKIQGNIARTDRSHALSVYPVTADLSQETTAHFSVVFAAQTPLSTEHTETAPTAPAIVNTRRTTNESTTANEPTLQQSVPTSRWAFFRLGIHHIATGWDHLAFLLGLLLLAPRWATAIKVVSAFTLAHSLTLFLAAVGWVTPPSLLIEPAIALSIAYVGASALWRRAAGHGMWLAFLFGLIHGFGFAGALAETLGSTARTSGWLLNLLTFNLGIETLQIVLVSIALMFYACAKSQRWFPIAHSMTAFAILASGLILFVVRLSPSGVFS